MSDPINGDATAEGAESGGASLDDVALFVILQEAIREAMESNREDEQ